MAFRLLADVTVLPHLRFVVFVVLGGLLVVRWPKAAWIHLPAAAWGAWVELACWVCPLTPLENWLRTRGGGLAYSSSFIEHYHPAPVPSFSLARTPVRVGALVLLVNMGIHAFAFRLRLRAKP